ncbi:MAG: carboxylating nicotinate-nucleotide diphosphorylase [Planctomycetota bacterium]
MQQQGTGDLDLFWQRDDVQQQLCDWIDAALEEDRTDGDRTSLLFSSSPDQLCRGVVSTREQGIVCGTAAMSAVFERLAADCRTGCRVFDGTRVDSGTEIMTVEGSAAVLLAGERIALNIGSHLCGIATRTARLVECAPTATILDTRKNIPGIRIFQKQAVRAGGGVSHRADLAEFPLVKENHRDLIQSLHPELVGDTQAELTFIRDTLRAGGVKGPIAIEVEDEESFRCCLGLEIEIILVDNISPEILEQWIARARSDDLPLRNDQIEASGGIDETSAAAYAAAGAGRISSGVITHSAPVLDLTMSISGGGIE